MAYEMTVWQDGDLITAERMNKLEQGVANNQIGPRGEKGADGQTPRIGENGNWWIGEQDTGIPATGPQGRQGTPGQKGDPGEKGETGAAGPSGKNGVDGKDGQTPRIGENGNWWIGTQDTGVPATGPKGEKGDPGSASSGVTMEEVNAAIQAAVLDSWEGSY